MQHYYRKHVFNENYFDKINNEEKAYWLGFLAADGYVCQKNYRIALTLKIEDINHLKKFADCIEYKGKIKTYFTVLGKNIKKNGKKDQYEMGRIYLNSKKMYFGLNKNGIISNKSLILKFPKFISNNLIRHYIRGYIDGDGCWSSDNTKYPTVSLAICGTKEFLEDIRDIFLKEKLIYKIGYMCQPSKIHIIKFAGNENIRRIVKWLYYNSTIFLDRKINRLRKYNIIDKNGKIIERKPIDHFGTNNPNSKKYKVVSPTGKIYIIEGGLNKFCIKNKITYRHLLNVSFNRRNEFMGWRCFKL